MRRLIAFESVSLDGYFAGADDDLSWAHKPQDDDEWNSFVSGNARSPGILVMGRKTYELMASFWPTANATKFAPRAAPSMNSRPKLVFSKTLKSAAWNNTSVSSNLIAAITKLKAENGDGMAILGSGSIVSQLAAEGLIDEFQLAVCPVVLGGGTTAFGHQRKLLNLTLIDSRTFKNGTVLLRYEPAAKRPKPARG